MLSNAQVTLPLKAKHILEAGGKMAIRYHQDERWDVMNALFVEMRKDLWKQFKKLRGKKAILSDHYKLSSYEQYGYLNFTLSIQVGILDI